jgi:hypothetical protein
MTLREELQQQLRAFVEGKIGERALFAWLGGAGRSIDSETAETREIWEAAFALLSEVGGRPHDIQDVQTDIADLLAEASDPIANAS